MSKDTKQLRRIAGALESLQPVASPRDTHREPKKARLPLRGRVVLLLGASEGKARRARTARRSYPIRAYVGPNGGGKSLAMVNDVLPSLDRGRKVLSTIRLLDHRTGEPHAMYEEFADFDQLMDAHHLDILMDEIVGIANARESSKLSGRVQNKLVQLRRSDGTMSWSAPNWSRADKIVREVTQAVTECRGYFADHRHQGDGDVRLWAPRRVFRFRTFETSDFEEWTSGKRDKLDPIAKQWFKGPGSRAFGSYDTLDAVTMVANASESGICENCDGTITRRRCNCGTPRTRRAQSVIPDLSPAGGQASLTSLEVDHLTGELIDLVGAEARDGRHVVVMLDDSTAIV